MQLAVVSLVFFSVSFRISAFIRLMIINCAYMNKAIFFRIVSGQLCKYMEDHYCICHNQTYWVEIDYTHCYLNKYLNRLYCANENSSFCPIGFK